MKIFKILLGFVLAVTVSSCGTTKSTTNVSKKTTKKEVVAKKEAIKIATNDTFAARKATMSAEEVQKWPHMDIQKDSVPGMSLDKAYEYLKNKKGETVIVAVIDSGIDIEHEDLKNVVWTNKDEIPNNGIDDDHNGYIDDIHGWNFLGGKKGEARPEQLEITRIVKKLHDKYGDEEKIKKLISSESNGKDNERVQKKIQSDIDRYKKLKEIVDKERNNALKRKKYYSEMLSSMKAFDAKIKKVLAKEVYTADDIKNQEFADDKEAETGKRFYSILESGSSVQEGMDGIQGAIDYFASKADTMYNIDFNGRVAGDDPDNINDVKYGNNLIIGSKDGEIHGTHVSGIICAERNNGVGMNGVSHNVALMAVRAVPDGDEYDKDVALAIRYAVDNGARVINMSFGKSYSPHRRWVYDAITYAEKNDVLLVHAAGNDNKSIDTEDNFPNDSYNKLNEFADNVLTVGAMTRHYDENICSSFSNYGKLNVDVFAPGSEIYSTFPKDEYQSIQGTSMASPEVAGVAALIRSYFPTLSASQVKQVIMESGITFKKEVKQPVGRGEKPTMVNFSTLSVSGKILNAYNAVIRAEEMVNQK